MSKKYEFLMVLVIGVLLIGMTVEATIENTDTGKTFNSLQAAIDDSDTDSGDTIEVSSGNYQESEIIVDKKNLTFKGPNAGIDPVTGNRGSEAVIDAGGNHNCFYVTVESVTISGFQFTNYKSHGVDFQAGLGSKVTYNIFNPGISALTAVQAYTQAPYVEVKHNKMIGVGVRSYLGSCHDWVIKDNLIDIKNEPRHGIVGGGSNYVISNNTIKNVGNSTDGKTHYAVKSYRDGYTSNWKIEQNVIKNNEAGVALDGNGHEASYNSIFNNEGIGLDFEGTAANNWLGTNSPTKGENYSDKVDLQSYALLSANASPKTVTADGNSKAEISTFMNNSEGETLTEEVPGSFNVELNTNLGKFSSNGNQNLLIPIGETASLVSSTTGTADVNLKLHEAQNTVKVDFVSGDLRQIEINRAGWSMIAPPLEPNNKNPVEVFGDNPMYHWKPGDEEFTTPADGWGLEAYHGFWIKLDEPEQFDLHGNHKSSATIVLEEAGWHQVGPPIDYNWKNVGVKQGNSQTMTVVEQADGPSAPHWMSRFIWKYTPEGYEAYDASECGFTMKPGRAYWVRTREPNVKLIIPYDGNSSSSTAKAQPIPMSSDKADRMNLPQPPMPAEANLTRDSLDVEATVTSGKVVFNVENHVDHMKVEVFNSNGKLVHQDQAQDDLTWNAKVANGLYLYMVTAKRNNKEIRSNIKKLLILS